MHASPLDILLVPSHGPVEEGSKLEPHALSRLQKAEALIRCFNYRLIVVSGGTVWGPEIQSMPLAQGMANWLLCRFGTEIDNRLIIEDRSRDTFENIYLSLQAIRNRLGSYRPYDLTVVTEAEQGRRIQTTLARGYSVMNMRLVTPSLKVEPIRSLYEACLLGIHQRWPLDGGPASEAMRRKRSYAAIGEPKSIFDCLREVRAEGWKGWQPL